MKDHHLQALSRIFAMWEAMGSPAINNQELIVKLIPKPTGGLRPIGLFPTLVRLWGKTRQPTIRAWLASSITDASMNMARGRRVGDASWRHKVLALSDIG